MKADRKIDEYSHWALTGANPKTYGKPSPLDSAIAFERYRLNVISRWPESEIKTNYLRLIDHALQQLESERQYRH